MRDSLIVDLAASAKLAFDVFKTKLTEDGTYSLSIDLDIAVLYKHPMMFVSMADSDLAASVLNRIVSLYFIEESGDFRPKEKTKLKSANPAYNEFYVYTNGWILRAALMLNRDDVLDKGMDFLSQFHHSKTGGFLTHDPSMADGITDVITTAHLGLVYLEAQQSLLALKAGEYLCETWKRQPQLDVGFYLRRDASGACLTDFHQEAAPICMINKSKPNQLYFMIAYPIAYLVALYKSTTNEKYLLAAKDYADFALSCHESVLSCEFSHKLAWALSELVEFFPEPAYLVAINSICQYFISIQGKDGLWFSNDELKCYDQSAEIVYWFRQIGCNLQTKKKALVNSQQGDDCFFAKNDNSEEVKRVFKQGEATVNLSSKTA